MSTTLNTTAYIPGGQEATPVSILRAISGVIGALESEADKAGVKPIWDRLEMQIESWGDEERSLTGWTSIIHHTGHISAEVLAVSPEEVPA